MVQSCEQADPPLIARGGEILGHSDRELAIQREPDHIDIPGELVSRHDGELCREHRERIADDDKSRREREEERHCLPLHRRAAAER